MTVAGTCGSVARDAGSYGRAAIAGSSSSTAIASTVATAGSPGLHTATRPRDVVRPPADPAYCRKKRDRSGRREPADDERRADGARLAERAQSDLRAGTADARDHRVEGDDGRALLRRNELVEVRLANGTRHAEPRRDEEQGGKRNPERPGDAENDRRRCLHDCGDEQQCRPPPAPPRCDAHNFVPGHRRQGYGGRDHADDPHRIALEQVEQIGLRRVERPAEEAELESRGEHEQTERPLPPAESDSCARILRDLRRQPARRHGPGREADIVHHDERNDEHRSEQNRPKDVRDAEVDLPQESTHDRAHEHRRARHL